MSGPTIGVDLGGTKIQIAVLQDEKVVGNHRVPTPHTGTDDVITAIADATATALTQAGLQVSDIRAVGLGSPGRIDTHAGVVSGSPNVPGFQEPTALGPLLSAKLAGAPVTLDNDVRVAMLGEHRRGAGRPYANVIGVFLGTGVGGGLILDGKLRDGRGAAGEIGHLIVKPGGRMCSDGRRGHLEAYAGRGRIEERARRLIEKGRQTILFDVMEQKGRTKLSSGVILHALEKGDKVTKELIADATWALATALASTQNLLDLEAIIIGGGLGDRLGQPFLDEVEATMKPLLFVPERPPALLLTELKDLSGAVGAAVLVGG